MKVFKTAGVIVWGYFLFAVCWCHSAFAIQNIEKDSINYYSKVLSNPGAASSLAQAFKYFENKRLESLELKDTVSAIYFYQKTSLAQHKLGDYYGCENSIVEALKLIGDSSSHHLIQNKLIFYFRLGKVYTELLDYERALQYYKSGLELDVDNKYINKFQNNLGLTYLKQGNLEYAEQMFQHAYSKGKALGDLESAYRALDNLGFTQSKLNNPEGISNMLEALKLKSELKHKGSIYASYMHLTQYYLDKHNQERAYYYALKGYEEARQINSPAYVKDALTHLLASRRDTIFQAYITLTDSLNTAEQLEDNKYAKIKYDYSLNEKKAQDNLLKLEREKRWKFTYLSLGILVALGGGFSIRYQKLKHRKDNLQQIYNTEKRISKKLHDEVANDVHRVLNRLYDSPKINDSVLDDLEHIYNRTRDISKDNSELEVNRNFDNLLNDLLFSYKTEQINIITRKSSELDWNQIDPIMKVVLFRSVQELLVNMKKHSQASVVVFQMEMKHKKVALKYADNGIGCEIKKGSGMQNMENRIKTIKGSITFESEPGKGFKVKMLL
ncbi:ATP-binding protein [Formosa sp. S-31]|uniref:ATP-binding protein n=1 Tax=Formosa sp. S-31 TaxID=2790949 RepID=UPI003EC02CEF